MTDYEDILRHYGILGMRWGERNGPPYPLGKGKLNSRERKFKNDPKAREAEREKIYSKKGKRPDYVKAAKIGASVVAAGLLAYGAYKLYDSRVLASANIGKNAMSSIESVASIDLVMTEKTKAFAEQYNIPLRGTMDQYESIAKDITKDRQKGNQDDCVPIGITACLQWMGLDVYPEYSSKGIGTNEFGSYFKGIGNGRSDSSRIRSIIDKFEPRLFATVEERAEYNKEARQKLIDEIERQCNGAKDACGLINIRVSGKATGHTTTWFKENGVVKFMDIQQNCKKAQTDIFDNYFNFANSFDEFSVARVDDLEPRKYILGPDNLNQDKLPIIRNGRK